MNRMCCPCFSCPKIFVVSLWCVSINTGVNQIGASFYPVLIYTYNPISDPISMIA